MLDSIEYNQEKLPQLEIEIAAEILNNILEECGIAPNTTPLDELEQRVWKKTN